MKPVTYVIRNAKSAAEIVKNISHVPEVDGKILTERHTFLLQGKPCVVYDLNSHPPWPKENIVDIPLLHEILTYPVAFMCHIDTASKFAKAIVDFIISVPDMDGVSDDEDTGTIGATTVAEEDTYEVEEVDMIEDTDEEEDDDEDEDEDIS
jgi:hypothetical protein